MSQRHIPLAGNFEIIQAVIIDVVQRLDHSLEVYLTLSGGHQMLVRGTVIVSQMQGLQPLAGFLDKTNLVFILRQIQMAGVQTDTDLIAVQRIDQQERQHARQQREEARNMEQQRLQNHFLKLEQQGEALKKVFPNFDLRTELQNPKFAQMTSPNSLMSLEDAYYAVHRKEIEAARSQVIAQKTAEKFSNAIQAGSRRPDENGTSGQAPSVTTFDYSKASKEQRESLKRQIYAARARGEKLYPGR